MSSIDSSSNTSSDTISDASPAVSSKTVVIIGIVVLGIIASCILFVYFKSSSNNTPSSSNNTPSSSNNTPSSSNNTPVPAPVPPIWQVCGGGNDPNHMPSTKPDVVFQENQFVQKQLDQNKQIFKATFGTSSQLGLDVTEIFCNLLSNKVADNFQMTDKFGGDPYPNVSKVLYIWYQHNTM